MTVLDKVLQVAASMDARAAVIATDDQGTIVHWNAAAQKLYGWEPSEALGRDVTDVTPAQSTKAQADEIMRSLLAGKRWSGRFVVRDRHGSPLVVHVENVPVMSDGRVVGIVGVSRPVQPR